MNWYRLTLLSLLHLLVDAYASFINPLTPTFTAALQISTTQAAGITVALSLTTSFTQPLWGMLGDRVGAKYLIAIGPLVAACLMGLVGLSQSYVMLLVFVGGAGLGVAAFHPAGAALAGEASAQKRAVGVGMFIVSGHLGLALGPMIAGWLVEHYGLAGSWRIIPPGIVLLVIATVAFNRPQPAQVAEPKLDTKFTASPAVRKIIILLVGVSTFRAFVLTAFVFGMPFWWTDMGFRESQVGFLSGLFLFAGGTAGFLCGWKVETGHEKPWIVGTLLLALPSLVLLPSLENYAHIVILVLIGGAALNATVPLVVAYAQRACPGGESVASSLMLGFSWGLGGIIAPFTVGYMLDHGGPIPALQWSTVFLVPATLCAIFLPKRTDSKDAEH